EPVVADEKGTDPVLHARAAWQLARVMGGKGKSAALAAMWNDPDPRFQVLRMRIERDLRTHNDAEAFCKNVSRYLTKKADPMVLREVLILLRNDPPEAIKDTLYELMKKYDGKDRFYLAAVGIAVGHHDQKRREALLDDFGKHFPEWDDKVAG